MNKLSEKYFTIGEFASLFKLSKQTLFYYERNNILRPAYIDENGYRYYSLEQYFIFDIIINMRKLGIPLKELLPIYKPVILMLYSFFISASRQNFSCKLTLCSATLLIYRLK